MKIKKLLSLTGLLLFLVASCQNREKFEEENLREENLKKELATTLNIPVTLTKLNWDDCYRLDLDILKDRREFIEKPESTFQYMHQLAERSLKYHQICQVFFHISDEKGLWFLGSIPKDKFESSRNIVFSFHEISFSEDLRKYACRFYKENAKEKAFLVCTKYVELKKLFSSD